MFHLRFRVASRSLPSPAPYNTLILWEKHPPKFPEHEVLPANAGEPTANCSSQGHEEDPEPYLVPWLSRHEYLPGTTDDGGGARNRLEAGRKAGVNTARGGWMWRSSGRSAVAHTRERRGGSGAVDPLSRCHRRRGLALIMLIGEETRACCEQARQAPGHAPPAPLG